MKTLQSLSLVILSLLFLGCQQQSENISIESVLELWSESEIERANKFLKASPITVTDAISERSAGGIHDFFSEGDYWWPNEEDPQAPFERRDGLSNPGVFSDHRLAVVNLSESVATLTSAWIITKEQKYTDKVLQHLNAWFVDTATMMNPNMLYAQAIYGRHTGRGIGLIDAYHFVEVAQSLRILIEHGAIDMRSADAVKSWFADFLNWMNTHPYGVKEMNTKNNHATCWLATASSFAVLTQNDDLIDLYRKRFKEVLLPRQMADDGSFPLELARTKPYAYSLFNIDAFCNVAQILSDEECNLWKYNTADGKSLKKGLEYIYPFIKNKDLWTLSPDVNIWEEWPVCHPSLLFGAFAYNNKDYLDLYLSMDKYPTHQEVKRNLPVRHPLIWLTY